MQVTSAITLALASLAASYQIPANLQAIYDAHKSGVCSNVLQGGFSPGVSSSDTSFAYCGDLNNAIYLHSDQNGGQYADMDVDCDGANLGAGKCANDPTGQGQTAFKDTVQSYGVGIDDLDANVHAFVVLGNSDGAVEFDPESYGVEPLSVVAVVCGGQVHYGVWGDSNGSVTVGEASMALADLCFPNENLNGDKGHGTNDVLYIAFKGQNAVPGAGGADWSTRDPATFENSLKSLGDSLVASLG